MKKIKLFMMLALLVVGVSNVWAAKTYTVSFNPNNIGGSIKVANEYVKTEKTYNHNGTEQVVYIHVTLSNNRLTLTAQRSYTTTNYYGQTVLNYSNIGDSYLDDLTKDNIYQFISVRQVDGYYTNNSLMTINGTNITIKYEKDNSTPYTEGNLTYSRKYVKSSSEVIMLPEGQVAVSLNLNNVSEVTDIISYNDPKNWNGDELNTGGWDGTITYATDDDGDGAGRDATYEYIGQPDAGIANMGEHNADAYFFNRTHTVKRSTVSEVTIPATTAAGDKVVAIQKWGFCYAQSHQTLMDLCSGGDTYTLHNNINDHSNEFLTKVTFADNCEIESIGDYAFMSCYNLQEIKIPWTVEYLGQGAFECCNNLVKAEFGICSDQSNTTYYGKTKVEAIREFTFWSCQKLYEVYLADGIKRIEGKSYGAAFQYLPALEILRMPNTLEYIGPHFLCSCTAIEKLIIPASVTYIDGACFHGCSALAEVYLLGEPADLKGLDGTSKTFDANAACCGTHVSNATFYVAYNELQNYKNHKVWKEVDENKVYNPRQGKYGNQILAIPETEITLQPGMWATIIFPKRISNTTGKIATTQDEIDELFGPDTHIAEMTAARHKDTDEATYQLTFVRRTEIVCGVPYMIKPGSDEPVTYPMFGNDDTADRDFRNDMYNDHSLDKKSDNDNAIVCMKGKYVKEDPLMKWDFVFNAKPNGNTYKYTFRKLVDGHAWADPCKCWWRILLNGYSGGGQNSKLGFFDDDDFNSATGINGVETEPRLEIEGIYDLNGRRIEVKQEELPAGLYIVNGKKVLKK